MGIQLEEVLCPMCGNRKYKKKFANRDILYGVEGEYQVVECQCCKLWYQNPQPTKECIGDLYPKEYGPYNYKGSTEKYRKTLSLLEQYNHKIVKKYIHLNESLIKLEPTQDKKGRLLEIGCANGEKLFQLQNLGYTNLYGMDISDVGKKRMEERGISFQCGDITEVIKTYDTGMFDTVIMYMTLEHLKNPKEIIDEITRILKPGGELLLSTITRDCFDWYLFHKNAILFDLPRHMVYFTKKQLLKLFQERFSQVDMATQYSALDVYRSTRVSKNILGWCVTGLLYTIPGHFGHIAITKRNKTSRVSFRCKK